MAFNNFPASNSTVIKASFSPVSSVKNHRAIISTIDRGTREVEKFNQVNGRKKIAYLLAYLVVSSIFSCPVAVDAAAAAAASSRVLLFF